MAEVVEQQQTTAVAVLPLQERVAQAVSKINVTNKFLENARRRANELVIKDVDDKEGFKIVKDARIVIRDRRIAAVAKAKELKLDVDAYKKAIIVEENRIIDSLKETERILQEKEDVIEAQKEAIRLEKKRKETEQFNARVAKLLSYNVAFNGYVYSLNHLAINNDQVKDLSEKEFDFYIGELETEYVAEVDRQVEVERIAAEAKVKLEAEQKAERDRLEAIAQEQANKQAELDQQAETLRLKQVELDKQLQAIEQAKLAALKEVLQIPTEPIEEPQEEVDSVGHDEVITTADDAAMAKLIALMGRIPYPVLDSKVVNEILHRATIKFNEGIAILKTYKSI